MGYKTVPSLCYSISGDDDAIHKSDTDWRMTLASYALIFARNGSLSHGIVFVQRMVFVLHASLFFLAFTANDQLLFTALFHFSSELFSLYFTQYNFCSLFLSLCNNTSDMAYTGNCACVEYFSGGCFAL